MVTLLCTVALKLKDVANQKIGRFMYFVKRLNANFSSYIYVVC